MLPQCNGLPRISICFNSSVTDCLLTRLMQCIGYILSLYQLHVDIVYQLATRDSGSRRRLAETERERKNICYEITCENNTRARPEPEALHGPVRFGSGYWTLFPQSSQTQHELYWNWIYPHVNCIKLNYIGNTHSIKSPLDTSGGKLESAQVDDSMTVIHLDYHSKSWWNGIVC